MLLAPVATTVSAPLPTLDVPKISAFVSVITTAFAPVLFRDTAPVKLFNRFNVITPAPVVKDVAPAPAACVMVPVCVMLLAPVATTVSVPLPTLDVPKISAFASVILTAFAPVLVRDTAPPKLFND